MKSTQARQIIGVAVLLVAVLVYLVLPDTADNSMLFSVLLYLPGFFVLIGLFDAWVSREFVVRRLGEHSGVKGAMYSFVLGCIIPGPLYLAFPLAAALLRKGISGFNVTLFIGAWSSFKIAEEIFELYFLGPRFLVLRVLLSVPFVIVVAFIVGRVCFDDERQG
ncbi:MAG: permease [archaeon]